jgi:ribosomal-protein-alanine N-acetyltransferase
MTAQPSPQLVRPMREHDLAQVMRIEAEAYEFPWSEGIFRDCLRVGYSCWSQLEDDRLVGYGIMTMGAEEAHVLNLCTDPNHQRKGFARRLLGHLMAIGARHGAAHVFLEVRVSNAAAQSLYASEGFSKVGVRKAYYPAKGGREDAIVLRRALPDANGHGG